MKRDVLPFIVVFLIIISFLLSPLDALADDSIERSGDILQFVLAATALGVTAIKHDGQGLLQYGKAEALSLSATYALKYTINEERPNGGEYSFPSGHTSFSFSSAEFLRKRYGWEYGLPAYAVASFVGYSRVESNSHYWHDVLAGAAIGVASSYLFTKGYQGVNVTAEVDQNYIGVRLSRSW